MRVKRWVHRGKVSQEMRAKEEMLRGVDFVTSLLTKSSVWTFLPKLEGLRLNGRCVNQSPSPYKDNL